MAAERDTVDRLIAGYLAERVGETFDARVSGVTKAGLFVQLPQYGADGFIPVSTLGDDYYIYDETPGRWSANAPAKAISLPTASRCASSKWRRSPARCASRC